MSVLDRLGRMVKSEWNARFHRTHDDGPRGRGQRRGQQHEAGTAPTRAPRPRVPAVSDVQGALRVLELSGTPSLAEVRAQYRALAQRYHPKTLSDVADDAWAARVVVEALTEALELLEEHLLPLPADDAPSARPSTAARG